MLAEHGGKHEPTRNEYNQENIPTIGIYRDDTHPQESPLSTEIMSTIIPRDFRIPDLKYSGRSDPLVHIERFNDVTGVQGLTPAQRCRMFPLILLRQVSAYFCSVNERPAAKSTKILLRQVSAYFCSVNERPAAKSTKILLRQVSAYFCSVNERPAAKSMKILSKASECLFLLGHRETSS